MQQENYSILTEHAIAAEQQRFMTKVFGWMFIALLVTGIVAMITANTPTIALVIANNPVLFFGLLISELILVGVLSALVQKLSAAWATFIFLLYSLLNGLTFSVIFMVFTTESIATTFFVTAGTFGIMAIYGYTTKRDLTKFGSFLFMALIGLILASVVNIFLKNSAFYWITTFAGIFIFVGLTAYDVQKIKLLNKIGNEGTDEDRKEAIMGALILYLDFINLFLYLLRLFGRRK